MASLCKRQQCTIERRGFRQELDSWRHKLVHCVGFESILEGLFGPGLIEDLKLFKDCEPEAVSDWSFDENCLFCCLRRDKVKEHLVGLSNQGLEDTPKPLLLKDQTKINRLEKQAEEFLNAVLSRKGVPNFSDPGIPVVARELMQRMIRQFAAEYTSKTSSSQDSLPDPQPGSVQSLPCPPLFAGVTPSTSPGAPLAAAAHKQNPVLSKLLMADQDAPLDLTIKKPLAEPTEQEGVLDLSLKKNRYSSSNSSLSGLRPYHSPNTSTLKGESPEMHAAKDLQSTSMLEQFMAKLCPHHQRQIVDTLGFLQTEVKALASSSSSQTTYYTSENQEVAPSSASSSPGTSKKSSSELRFPLTSTPKGQEMSLVIPSNFSIAKKVPDGSVSLKPSDIAGPAFDLNTFGLGSEVALVNQNLNTSDSENSRHNDHAPLKMKIMKTNKLADGKKLACVLTTSLLTQSDGMQERQGNSDSSNKTEPHSARLSSSAKRPNQSGHTHQVKNRDPLGQTKDTPTKTFTIHRTSNTLLQDSPRTARKTIRGSSDHRTRDPAPRVIVDPDLGHCDIVYIDKPITECLREQQHHMPPRRNARKSTRGHMYVEEMWELKTVRTLAGRNERGNCPNPMPEINTLVTPKQVLAKPDGVPPVDMPFAGDCGQTIGQQMPSEESDEREIPGTGDVMEATTTELDLIVETSQTDQSKVDDPSSHHSTLSSPTENGEENLNEDIVQDETTDSIQTGRNELSEEIVLPSSHEAVKEKQELDEDPNETTEHVVAEKGNENDMMEESQPLLISDTSEPEQQQKEDLPAVLNTAQEEVEEKESEPTEDEEPLKPQVEAPKLSDNLSAEKNSGNTAPAEEIVKEQQIDTVETVTNVLIPVAPVEIKEDYRSDDEYDVSTKTLESLLKELPPWRRKRGTVISLPKRLREAKNVIVGYVNGRPISASDRSLRRRSSNGTSPPPSTSVKPRRSMSKISSAENTPSKKHLHLEKGHIKSETVIPQETEETPETPQTTESEHPTMSSGKQITNRSKAKAKRNRVKTEVQSTNDTLPATLPDQTVDSSKSIESEQQTTESPLSAEVETQVAANANTSASPRRLTPSSPLFTGDAPPLPVSSTPLCVVAPPLMSSSQVEEQSPQTSSEQSQQCMNPERTVELSIAYAHSADTPPDEIKITEVESIKQTKQKHSSINVPVEINKDEKLQVCNEVSCPLESQNLIGNEKETQGTPLRSRTLRKEETSELALKKSEEETMDDKPSGGVSNCTSVSDKPVRMPLRSESSKVEMLNQSLTQPAPIENMKPALRSQRFATPSTSEFNVAGKHKQIVSPIRRKPVVIHRSPVKSPSLSVSSMSLPSSVTPFSLRPIEPHRQTAHKLIETLNGEDNQQLITNLNIKFDKMQKGWIQMDKEGHPATKYRNKADRQAAIWKSKRRARKPKCIEHHKYSPVQMLFMKNFNLTSICRWFLESTETKSLVIVKKVNTRLPSETQLCFHSSSGMSGTSDGVFPSLQAERLKKHLKKFAVASPVKSNPKSQKLIAKAFEQEAVLVKGKDRGELPNPTLTDFASAEAQVLQLAEVQKVTGKSKNPASARILRKYSNIREKMQVQQTSVRLKETTKSLKRTTAFKKLTTSKSSSKAHVKSPLKTQKTPLPVPKQMKEPAATMARGKTTPGRKTTAKPAALEKKVKSPSTGRASKDLVKKESDSPQRCSQRLGSPKTQKSLIQASTSKVYSNKNQPQTEKTEVEKLAPTNPTSTKSQIKESSQNKVAEGKGVDKAFEMPQQSTDTKTPSSPDQVLTRSQKKLEAMLPVNASPTPGSRKTLKSIMSSLPNSTAKKAMGLKVTRSATPKSVAIKGLTSPASRRVTKKLAAKRRLEPLETPAKRTRMSQLK